MGRAGGRTDVYGRGALGPAKRPSFASADRAPLRQQSVAADGRMHGIEEEHVTQDSAGTGRGKGCLAVDQKGLGMSGGDLTINLLKVARTAHQEAVEISGRAVMRFGLTPVSRTFEQPRQPKMSFGEARLIGQDRPVRFSGASGVTLLAGAARSGNDS